MAISSPHVLTTGELRPTNGSDQMASFGHPSKFQRVTRLGFVTAATSLTRGQLNFARCLDVSWAGTLDIHSRGLLPPDGILPGAKFTLRPSLAFSYIDSVTARHPAVGVSRTLRPGTMELRNFRRGHHLYSAGRPSRWASAHILQVDLITLEGKNIRPYVRPYVRPQKVFTISVKFSM